MLVRLNPEKLSPTDILFGSVFDIAYTDHAELNDAVMAFLRDNHFCLILDCHSFPLNPLPYEVPSDQPRPEICLGTDPFHTPEWLARAAEQAFTAEGFEVALNHPFGGTMVPTLSYRRDLTVLSLMIEVQRSLYIDELSGERLAVFSDFRRVLLSVLKKIIALAKERRQSPVRTQF
jgi:N-formylglutamate deformylase